LTRTTVSAVMGVGAHTLQPPHPVSKALSTLSDRTIPRVKSDSHNFELYRSGTPTRRIGGNIVCVSVAFFSGISINRLRFACFEHDFAGPGGAQLAPLDASSGLPALLANCERRHTDDRNFWQDIHVMSLPDDIVAATAAAATCEPLVPLFLAAHLAHWLLTTPSCCCQIDAAAAAAAAAACCCHFPLVITC
jgi:hypothetical protein